jgi:chromosomal replication initiator protein
MPEQKHQARQRILEFPARPEYSFSNFVVSKGSDVAFQAAREICADKPSPRNTLYLFGGKNLGKTHLLISIGNETAAQGKKAMYVHGSDFVRKTDENANGSAGQFVSTLSSVDLFLLDAVEYISGQRASQEKLYLVYNTLIENGKRTVFAGNLNPAQLGATESYLTSRFQWGMVAQLNPIDDDTTAKIILKLAKDLELVIPENIVDYLLARIPRDFLSIKHAIEKINHESYIQRKKVSVPLIRMSLNLP